MNSGATAAMPSGMVPGEEFIAANHAIMMYEPLLPRPLLLVVAPQAEERAS